MNEFLNAVKEDLSDRRMLPFVGAALALLIGALAYVALAGGGSGSSSPAPVPHAPPLGAAAAGLAVSQVQPASPVGETTSGVAIAHAGSSRDPFTLLPGAGTTTARAGSQVSGSGASQKASAASSSGASSGSGAGAGSSASGSNSEGTPRGSGSGGSGQSSPKQPAKPKTVYQVSVLFGEAPGGTSGEGSQLKPYENLKLLTPLPSKQEPLIVFRGVSDKGKRATFTVAGETILHGTGRCLPSADQCEAIQLSAGQSEQLQYLPPGSQTVQSYELRLVGITATEASKAALASLWGRQSQAGMQVLLSANLMAIPGLSGSALAGVLVPAR